MAWKKDDTAIIEGTEDVIACLRKAKRYGDQFQDWNEQEDLLKAMIYITMALDRAKKVRAKLMPQGKEFEPEELPEDCPHRISQQPAKESPAQDD